MSQKKIIEIVKSNGSEKDYFFPRRGFRPNGKYWLTYLHCNLWLWSGADPGRRMAKISFLNKIIVLKSPLCWVDLTWERRLWRWQLVFFWASLDCDFLLGANSPPRHIDLPAMNFVSSKLRWRRQGDQHPPSNITTSQKWFSSSSLS